MKLNDQQKAAAQSTAEKTLVIAGPGSGKTATLTARIVFLLEAGIPPSRIVAITFTNAAADEIQKRVEAQWCGENQTVRLGFIGTIHSYAMKLLREHGTAIGLPGRLSVMDETQAAELLEATARKLHYKGTKKALEEGVKARLANLRGGFQVADPTRPNLDAAGLVAFEFIHTMAAEGSFSFDAIVAFAHPVLCAAFDAIAKTVEHVLVDEYQDCAEDVDWLCAALPGRKFFVGDPDQAIYGFAGGNVSYIVGYANDKAWSTYILEDNYRSTPNICGAAQRLIESNMNRVRKATRPVSRPDEDWQVAAFQFAMPHQEVDFVARELRVAREARKTCAVLARSNYIANATALALEQQRIVVRKKEKLAKPGDFGLARRFVALASNPENDSLAYWFLNATRGQKFADKTKLEAAEAGRSINGHLLKMPEELDVKQVPDVLAKIAVSAESIAIVKKAIDGLRDGDGVAELGIALGNPELHYREVGDGSAVTVTTIHAAKGREWDWVFIVGSEDAVIPGKAEGPQLYEERRLMFVAVTRARERVVLTHCETRTRGEWQKRPEPAIPSRFLYQLGIVN